LLSQQLLSEPKLNIAHLSFFYIFFYLPAAAARSASAAKAGRKQCYNNQIT